MRQGVRSCFFGTASWFDTAAQVDWPPRCSEQKHKRKRELSSSHSLKRHASDSSLVDLLSRGVSKCEGLVSEDKWQGRHKLVMPSVRPPGYTPLENQVVELKAKYPDVVLLVEVGYKFRFFADDAHTASCVLGIVAHQEHHFLTASIPTFRLHVHVRRLVEAGYKVGVVNQSETAASKAHGTNKVGPFPRHLSALYTRATLGAARSFDLQDPSPRYLLCIAELPDSDAQTSASVRFDITIAVVAVDVASGHVLHGMFQDNSTRSKLDSIILTLSPAELLLLVPSTSSTLKLLMGVSGSLKQVRLECVPRDQIVDMPGLGLGKEEEPVRLIEAILDHFGTTKKETLALPDLLVDALALGLWYLKQFGLEKLLLTQAVFRPLSMENEMILAPNVIRQLELLKNSANETEEGSLLWLMDQTCTPFGARLFRHWVTHPLSDRHLITTRLDAVGEIADSLKNIGLLPHEGMLRGSKKWLGASYRIDRDIRARSSGGLLAATLLSLVKLPDVERGITRIFHRTASPGEFVSTIKALVALSKQLTQLTSLSREGSSANRNTSEWYGGMRSALLRRLVASASSSVVRTHGSRLLSLLNLKAAAAEDKLNLFTCRNGTFPEVLSCHTAIDNVEKQMDCLMVHFRKALMMPELQFASVSGSSHLIEVPTSQKVPDEWLRVNSTKKVYRYHPPEILASLDQLARIKDQLSAICHRAWDAFLAEFATYYLEFQVAVHALSELDCLLSLALLSSTQGYVRPIFVEDDEPCQLSIEGGRHPVLESRLGKYVANDTFLHMEHERCQLITGPNMGGKSSYLRQVALIAIMAQIGSYVPATSARLHVLDAIYTRMGAGDKTQHQTSTFFEELSEASLILQNASPRSLVIIDELGRGTSTYDGFAISYATLQHLLLEIRCFVLFVTHYPEMAELKIDFPTQIVPFYVSFLRKEPELSLQKNPSSTQSTMPNIIFLYKLVRGLANRSFGLHVAYLAQIPQECILRASILAAALEEKLCWGQTSRCTGFTTPSTPCTQDSCIGHHGKDVCSTVATRKDIRGFEEACHLQSINAALKVHWPIDVTVSVIVRLHAEVAASLATESI